MATPLSAAHVRVLMRDFPDDAPLSLLRFYLDRSSVEELSTEEKDDFSEDGYSSVDVDEYVPLSYLARFSSPRGRDSSVAAGAAASISGRSAVPAAAAAVSKHRKCGYCPTRTADPPVHINDAVDRFFSLRAMAARESKSFVPCDDCRSFLQVDRSAASPAAASLESKP